MGKVEPIEKDWTADKGLDECRTSLLAAIKSLNGRVTQSTDTHIECDFGMRILTWVISLPLSSRSMLPKRADVTLERTAEGRTKIRLVVKETLGPRLGGLFEGKLTQAIDETARAIQDFSQRA